MRTAKAHIGTSGWNYKHWAGGRFYPPRLAARHWLEFYAEQFSTVEVNNSFYRIPSAESMAAWSQAVPPAFTFALKVWRGITHYRKLRDTGEFLRRFFEFANVLEARHRGPLLVQLPPNMGKNVPRLDDFLGELHEMTGPSRWKVAIEFRNPQWLSDDVYKVLDRRRAAVALVDGRCPATEPNDVGFVYVRRHGAHSPEGRYSPEHIREDARQVRAWLRAGKTVYVYYNNDFAGHAVDNARQLIEAVEGR